MSRVIADGLSVKAQADLNLSDELFTNALKNKLDAIEANATVDQTNSEIKSAYEANADTNEFSDSEQTKLSNIESSATNNDTNAQLRARSSHTGTQSVSTITGLADAATTSVSSIQSGTTKSDVGLSSVDNYSRAHYDARFDAAGDADTAVSDHVALPDPHAQYALESTTPVDFLSTSDDVDTLVKSGFYRLKTNANIPYGAHYGQLIVSSGGDTILQLVSSYNGRLWQRSGNPSNVGANGSYSDWQEIPSLAGGASANFTAMPQVGGDPIVESGSNADGEFTRWSDGTQICYKTDATFTAISGGGRMDAPDWDYPSAFSATPTFAINLLPNTGLGSGAWNDGDKSQTKVSFFGARDSSFVKAVNLRIYAIAGESFVVADFVDNNSLTAVGRWQ